MTVIGALSSFRELGEMSPHKRCQHSGTGRSWKHPRFQLRCRLLVTYRISVSALAIMHSPRSADFRLPRRNSAMGQGLGLAAVSEARASACVSTYSRTFVNLPF